MEKRPFESFEVFSCLKKVNPKILSTTETSAFNVNIRLLMF